MKTAEQYDEMTVPQLQNEILDREIEESTSGLKKAELIELLIKDDERRATGKFKVPSFEEYAKAYPGATQEGYVDRFCGLKKVMKRAKRRSRRSGNEKRKK